ncbi:MAG: hypothetical protein H5T86_01150 [Armatimonadetes bacterium]|nr:hypothetical protein [Armatimonadota bacterium]
MLLVGVLVCACLLAAFAWGAAPEKWALLLLPEPQECELGGELAPPGQALSLHLPAAKGLVAEQIAVEMAAAIGEAAKLTVAYDLPAPGLVLTTPATDAVTLFSREASAQRARVQQCPNADQAYLLQVAKNGNVWSAAVVIAVADAGMYYGHKTLKQLIEATVGNKPIAPALSLPEARVLDWPDMPERGEWGGYAFGDIDWLADLKMNLIEDHASLSFDESGHAHATYPADKIEQARRRAMKLVPIITHLDQLERRGIFKHHPQVRAEGKEEDFRHWGTVLWPVCWAKPEAVQIMTEWMQDLARIPEVTAITVWLSEDHGYCHCPACVEAGQFVMETRAALAAWREARKIKPDLELRILLTQGSYETNEAVLKEIPIGERVGVIHYHGDLTYMPYKREMIEPYMTEFVKRGGWLGVCPMLGSAWRIVSPFSCPQFIHMLMQEVHAKGLKCLYGYATPGNRWWDMNVQAAAEWAWNRNGRDIGEFARAWGARRGLDPDLTARWVETLGPASWDVYSARVPYPWFFGSVPTSLRKGERFQYGSGPLASIASGEHMQADRTRAQEAEAIARQLGAGDLVAESRVIADYLRMLQALKELSDVLADAKAAGDKLTDVQRQRIAELLTELDQASNDFGQQMVQWAEAIGLPPGQRPPSRFLDTINEVERTVSAVGDICEALGVPDPGRPFRWHKIGEWKTEDFDQASPITKKIDVSQLVDGPGAYEVRFAYRTGELGLVVTKVSLIAVSEDGQARIEAVDEHRCHAGAWNEGEVYTLRLAGYNEANKYSVEIVMAAGQPQTPRQERTSTGDIFWRKVRP